MPHNISKKEVHEFLISHRLAILSTVNERGTADAAPIYYIVDNDFNFFFVTPTNTQKHENLMHQKEVVLTITDDPRKTTVQVRGRASEKKEGLAEALVSLSEKIDYSKEEVVATLPLFSYKDNPKVLVKIAPSYVRMRAYHNTSMDEAIIEPSA